MAESTIPNKKSQNEGFYNLMNEPYKYGFETKIEKETIRSGLNEETVRLISEKKNEPKFMLDFRLKAFKKWQTMLEPEWSLLNYAKPNYQDITYYSAPKKKPKLKSREHILILCFYI